jgi:hypothetical protein
MYINFWYPMIRSEELDPRRPEHAMVVGLNFAIFRDGQGQSRVLSETCVHRGGSLDGASGLHKNPRNSRTKLASSSSTCATSSWGRSTTARTREVRMPADKGVVAYRKWRSTFDDKGARNRVLGPVPLLASRAGRNASKEATG